jgi:hypothetical protein
VPYFDHSRLLSRIKDAAVPRDTAPRTVKTGAFRGLHLRLDLTRHTQLWLGLYERETQSWLSRLVDGSKTAIDVGAAQGLYTAFLAKRTEATILAFEPDPGEMLRLRENLELNALLSTTRVTLASTFIGASVGPGIVTLDSLVSSIEWPVFIKVDVEGAEFDVLKGSATLMRGGDTRWLIETHSADLEVTCIALLEAAGLEVRIVPNAPWRRFLPETRPIPHNRWLVAFTSR